MDTMKKITAPLILLLIFLPFARSLGTPLSFFVGDRRVKSLSLKELKKAAPIKDVRLEYHFSKSRVKNYRGVELAPLLRRVFPRYLKGDEYSEIIYEATDGYSSFSTLSMALTKGGLIAFKDLDRKGDNWEPTGREMASPAPYFLVWAGKDQTSTVGYPWPYALVKIRLVRFKDRYPKLFPTGKPPNSPERRGLRVFKEQCFRCHAIDREGGKIGPDLAAPRHILDYRTETFIRQFIKNPESFRYSKMPSHAHLSGKEMDDLMAYLKSRRVRP
ncbi:MAG: cytochrome c [Bacteriovoracales bacterium]|nr:cytochrome c [Bacteriovoracales bacterium]